MRRINLKMIPGAGPKRALSIEKPSQRIARRERALVLRKLTGLPKAPCPRCPPYRLICDKCALADDAKDSFTRWRENKLFQVGQPVSSRDVLAANKARLRALIRGGVRSDPPPRASE